MLQEDVGKFKDSAARVTMLDGSAKSATVYVYDANGKKVEAGRAHSMEAKLSATGNEGDSGTGVHTYYYERSNNNIDGLQGRGQPTYKINTRADTKTWVFPQPSMLFDMILESGFERIPDMTFYQRGGLETSAVFICPNVELPDFLGGYDVGYWKTALAAIGKEPRLATSPIIELSYGIEPSAGLRIQFGWYRWVCTNGMRRFNSGGGYKSDHSGFDWKHLMKWLNAVNEGMKMGDYKTNVLEDGWAGPGSVIENPAPRTDDLRDIFMGDVEIMSASAMRHAAVILEAASLTTIHPITGKKVPLTTPSLFGKTLPTPHKKVLGGITSTLDKSATMRTAYHLNLLADSLEADEPVYSGQLSNALSSAITDARLGVGHRREAVIVERMNDLRTMTNTISNVAAYTWSESFIEALQISMGAARNA